MQMREKVGKSRNTVFFQWFLALEGRKVGRKDAFSVAGAVQETCSSEMLGGPGTDFLRGVAFWSIRSSVLGRWFCVTGAALRMGWPLFFVAAHGLEKSQTSIGTRPSALHSTVQIWRRSRKIASFLMLPTSKIEEVSLKCFVFDVIKFKSWRRLAELLRFSCCHLRKWRKPCRIASFSNLQIDRSIDRWMDG